MQFRDPPVVVGNHTTAGRRAAQAGEFVGGAAFGVVQHHRIVDGDLLAFAYRAHGVDRDLALEAGIGFATVVEEIFPAPFRRPGGADHQIPGDLHAVVAQLAGESGFLLDGQDVAAENQQALARPDGAHRVQAVAVRARGAGFDVGMEPVE